MDTYDSDSLLADHERRILEICKEHYEDRIHNRYVNAEIDDGSEIAELMRYFKTADPDDTSHGVLSERVHFLKCEEKGLKIMCEVTDKFIQAGIKYGIEQGRKQVRKQGRRQGSFGKAREVTANLARIGMPIGQIASVVGVNTATVTRWLEQAPVE